MQEKLIYWNLLVLLLCSCADRHKDIVAEFDGQVISSSELSVRTRQEMFDLLNMAYEIKMKALDDLIKQRLLEGEAKKKGVSVEQYMDWYVASKAVSDSSVQQKYKQRGYIIQQLADSLFQKSKINRYIYPPQRRDLKIDDLPVHYRGNLSSSVSLVVASDFDCQKCIEFEKTLNRLYEKYQDRVKFGFVYFAGFPSLPALACEAAAKQNKFWEFHDAAFSHREMSDSTFLFQFAAKQRCDMTKFKTDLYSEETYKKVDHTMNVLVEKGLFATPTVIVNNRLIYMTNSFEELSNLLDVELNRQ